MAINCKFVTTLIKPVIFSIAGFVFQTSYAQQTEEGLTIKWEGNQAVGFIIPNDLIKNNATSDRFLIEIKLLSRPEVVLGQIERLESGYLFKPLIPLQQNNTYVLYFEGKEKYQLKIPIRNHSKPPEVIGIFPSCDTIPENLLKIYIQFSATMGHNSAYDYITIRDEGGEEIRNVFLKLESELWNRERTLLTLWLDPGRIKRDLVPNKLFGQPLKSGKRYTILLSNQFRDALGSQLTNSVEKTYFVSKSDRESPSVKEWELTYPKAGSLEPLTIRFPESLDYSLLKGTATLLKNKQPVEGTFISLKDQKGWQFMPNQIWERGTHALQVLSILEDLAGNNLNRLFDVDLSKKVSSEGRPFHYLAFKIQ